MQKNKSSNLYPMAVTALLVAISLILAKFAIMIPLFGYPSVRFSVSGVPIFLAGSLFGPVLGATAGFISDIISFMLSGNGGPYHIGFTINSMIVGLIPGLIFMWIRNKKITYCFNKLNATLSIVALVVATIYINFIGIHELENIGNIMGIPVNILLTVLMIIIVVAQIIIMYLVQKHFGTSKENFSIDKLMFICMVNYMVIQLLLTPIWLNQLYNIPISASVFVRVFKSIVDIPLQSTLIYIVMRALPMQIKRSYTCKAS